MGFIVFASDFCVKMLLLYKAFQVKSLTFKFITDPNEEMYMWAAQQQNGSSETCQHFTSLHIQFLSPTDVQNSQRQQDN